MHCDLKFAGWLSCQGNRRYIKCLYVYNKIDICCMEEVDEIARRPNSIPISCFQKLNLDGLLEKMWDMMSLVSMQAFDEEMCPTAICTTN